jgi:hypothetical protein
MEDLSSRTAQEVLDDHLNLAENWGAEVGFERGLEEDLRRNTLEDIVILINRGTFRGHEGSGSWRTCSLRSCPSSAPSSTPTGQ